MAETSLISIIRILRNTLRRLESGTDFRRDDPAVIHFKRSLVRAVAELEHTKSIYSLSAPEVPGSETPISALVQAEDDSD